MRKINYPWVKEQFAAAKLRVGVGKAVLKMLKTWEEIDLDPAQSQQVFEILSKVGLGHSLVTINPEELWVDTQRGQLVVGDIVRVRHNAFDGELGYLHNGRRGIVVAIRSGDIIFKSTDDFEPPLESVHYRPEALQKRLR
jgi:hypothetical protein